MRPLEATDPRSIGAYTILGVLGRGGMGKVFLGQSWTGKRVAIKVIRPEIADDPVFRQRFAREVEAGRAISALYTAPIVDADPQAETPWFATTYIEGPSLEDEVATSGPMSVSSVLILAAGLAEAFIAIHRAGLVHRDLKPSNVLLTKDGPCVIDFGIALIPDSTALTQGVIGTPAYMSPEHVAGAEVGPASDIFSIGATLAFAATGQGPLGQGTPHSLIARLISGQLDTSAVPEQLKPIVARCLARNAQYRPNATELLSLLAAAGATHPYPGWYSPSVAPPAVPAMPVSAAPAPASQTPPSPAPASPTPPEPVVPPHAHTPPQPHVHAPTPVHASPQPQVYPAPQPAHAAPQPAHAAPQPVYAPPQPAYGVGQAPPYAQPQPGYRPPGYPPYSGDPSGPPSSRRGLWITLALVAIVLVGGGVTAAVLLIPRGNDNPVVAQSTAAPSASVTTSSTPIGTLTLSAPQALAGLTKSTQADLQKSADQVVTDIKNEIDGETGAVAAFYNDPRAAGKRVLFIGVTADIVSPAAEIDDTFTSFNSSGDIKISHIADAPPGPLGGKAKCGDGATGEVKVVLCVWADNESLGMVIFYNRSLAESKDLFVRVRGDATSRV